MDKIGTRRSRWTQAEIEQVRNGIVPDGRTLPAARAYATQHGFKFTNASRRDGKTSSWSRWTPEEVKQVRQGIVPDGRTLSSARAYAFNHDIRFSPVDSRRKSWSEAEDNMLRAGQVPEGRTLAACRVRAYGTLGVKFSPPKPRVPRWAADGRAEAMWLLRAHGFGYAQVGKFFGVSGERVRQIADRYAKWSGKGRGESAPGSTVADLRAVMDGLARDGMDGHTVMSRDGKGEFRPLCCHPVIPRGRKEVYLYSLGAAGLDNARGE